MTRTGLAFVALLVTLGAVLSGCPEPQTTVPNVVGQTRANAEAAITAAGLVVGTVTQAFSETVATGNVIDQNPGGGARVSEGSNVDLVISKGPEDDLPPDPGPAGDATLEGVDSDSDGTRDDLEIAIFNRHPDDPSARQALTGCANALQDAIAAGDNLDDGDTVAASDAITRSIFALHDNADDPAEELAFIELEAVDTAARSDAYLNFNENMNGEFVGTSFVQAVRKDGSIGYVKQAECEVRDTTNIYFVNGVWNTYAQAESGRVRIELEYETELEDLYPEQKFEFFTAYNYHSGSVLDIIEVIGQKLNEINDPETERYTAEQYFQMYMTARDFNAIAPPPATALTEVIEDYLAQRMLDTINAAEHVQKYRANLLEGKRVLLIAHSQGNLFANQAVAALMGLYGSSIGMIGVASPAAVTYNGSPYFTADDDRVIDALRIIHDVLPANIDNDPGVFLDPRDFSNHQFVPSYFTNNLPSEGLIDNATLDFMQSLEFPDAQLGGGAIVVTLEWGSQPDVDLHVFEPGGSHVYYSARQGEVGFLDLDDVTGFGPEHYFADCEDLQEGTYRVGVNYYSGSAPETARVQIETADGRTRSYAIPLTTSRGSSGNASPVPVAQIVVSRDEEDQWVFSVE